MVVCFYNLISKQEIKHENYRGLQKLNLSSSAFSHFFYKTFFFVSLSVNKSSLPFSYGVDLRLKGKVDEGKVHNCCLQVVVRKPIN